MRCGPLISDRVLLLSKHRQKNDDFGGTGCTSREQQGGDERTNKNEIKHERVEKRQTGNFG